LEKREDNRVGGRTEQGSNSRQMSKFPSCNSCPGEGRSSVPRRRNQKRASEALPVEQGPREAQIDCGGSAEEIRGEERDAGVWPESIKKVSQSRTPAGKRKESEKGSDVESRRGSGPLSLGRKI